MDPTLASGDLVMALVDSIDFPHIKRGDYGVVKRFEFVTESASWWAVDFSGTPCIATRSVLHRIQPDDGRRKGDWNESPWRPEKWVARELMQAMRELTTK